MVVGAGAHLHRFIEGIETAILTCSGGASSKYLLGREQVHDVRERVRNGEAKGEEGGDAHQIGQVEAAEMIAVSALGVGDS